MMKIDFNKIQDKQKDHENYNYIEDLPLICKKKEIKQPEISILKSPTSQQARDKIWRAYIREQAKWERKMTKWLKKYFQDQRRAVLNRVKSLEGLGIIRKHEGKQ